MIGKDDTALPAVMEEHGMTYHTGGFTARQYAAIHLCVPDSGTQWLDEMIQKRLLDELAARAMSRIVAADKDGVMGPEIIAQFSYYLADAMVKESAK